MSKLYELTGKYRQLMDEIIDWDTGEVDESRVDNFEVLLGQIEDGMDAKIDGCGMLLKNIDAEKAILKTRIESLRKEADRLSKRHDGMEAKQKSLKKYVRDCLHVAGLTKWKTRLFTAFMSKPRNKLDIYDPKLIPANMRKEAPPDTVLIKRLLERKEEVPGARLIEGETPLTFR